MARQFAITDGTTTVSLINTDPFGIMADRGGLGPTSISPDVVFNSPINAHGATLGGYRYPPVIEEYRVNIFGSSEDQAAAQLQQVLELLRKARQYNGINTPWQRTPVYIISQTADETNTRYGQILAVLDWSIPDLFRSPFETDNRIEQYRLTIARAPFWRSTIPETLPAFTPIGNAAYNAAIIADLGGNFTDLVRTEAAALNGDYGGAIIFDGTTPAFWDFDFPVADTAFSFEFLFDPNTMDIDDGEGVYIIKGETSVFVLVLRYTIAGGYNLQIAVLEDVGFINGDVDISDVSQKIKIQMSVSTGPGNDDGIAKVYIDDVLEIDLSGLDNDTKTLGAFEIGAQFFSSSGVAIGTLYYDDIKYADSIDDDWHFTIDFENTETIPVSNYDQQTQLTHMFNYDNSLTAFSENLIAQHDAELFVVAGSTPALNDICYIGSDEGVFFSTAFHFQAVKLAAATIIAEYWDGGAWQTFNTSVTFSFQIMQIGFINAGNDWVQSTENGVNAYWIRFKISALTTWNQSPKLSKNVYATQGNYIELATDAISGDEAPDTMIYASVNGAIATDRISWVAMGLKSRGLDIFQSSLNAGGSNPDNWSEVYGTDTAQTASGLAPSGNMALCDFSTIQTMVERLEILYASVDGRGLQGAYRLYLGVRQTAGSVGEVSIKVQTRNILGTLGDPVSPRKVSGGIELLDMGRFEILSQNNTDEEGTYNTAIRIEIFAESTGGTTPNLEIHTVYLLPVDEWSMIARSPDASDINQILFASRGMSADSGVFRKSTSMTQRDIATIDDNGFAIAAWVGEGQLPIMNIGDKQRVYFIFGTDDGNGILEAPPALGLNVKTYNVEHWLHLRGAE